MSPREESRNLIKIAQVLKSNGTDGEIVLGTRDIAPEDIDLKEPVFIHYDGLPVPFFIESFVPRGTSKALVHLTGIESFDDAEEIVGKGIFADVDTSGTLCAEQEDFSVLIGWTLFDAAKTDEDGKFRKSESGEASVIGEITDFLDIPDNPCIEVGTKKGAVTIPLHEDLILSVNPDRREIIMEIPDGLLDV